MGRPHTDQDSKAGTWEICRFSLQRKAVEVEPMKSTRLAIVLIRSFSCTGALADAVHL